MAVPALLPLPAVLARPRAASFPTVWPRVETCFQAETEDDKLAKGKKARVEATCIAMHTAPKAIRSISGVIVANMVRSKADGTAVNARGNNSVNKQRASRCSKEK